MKKKGSEKYYILMSIILGIIVLAISLYFIFNEYFTGTDLDQEACRQSVYLRSISPNFGSTDLKDALPLKCKTEVVNIDTADSQTIFSTISDTIAAGWFMFGEGKYDIVPTKFLDISNTNYCLVFARVHFSDKAKEEFKKQPLDKFGSPLKFENFYKTTRLNSSMESYNQYLPLVNPSEKQYYFLWYSSSVKFNPDDDNLLFIYETTKYPGHLKAIPVLKNIANWVWGIDEHEKTKSIFIATQSDIDKIGCSEFLTIPA